MDEERYERARGFFEGLPEHRRAKLMGLMRDQLAGRGEDPTPEPVQATALLVCYRMVGNIEARVGEFVE